MFYSQFILAKKGPLGTIWIAAHLERKLRKNQVSDTDIGVSVDSILFPEMPIALRLSSHLLLGVVRIYSKKVSYLFDDCSEALLKVKNAFRANAVDLPPEESTAPYHAITLPETFDLDDFELPDHENLQGSFVDHHVGAKDQITLQDTMEGVIYSTSEFGRDERFGDGEASHLDLNEEIVVEKAATAATTEIAGDTSNPNVDPDPQTSVQAKTPIKDDEIQDALSDDDGVDQMDDSDGYDDNDADYVPDEYAEGPSTPGLWEEPNLPKVLETSTCVDQQEPVLEPVNENLENVSQKVTDYVPHQLEKSTPMEDTSMIDFGSTHVTESNVGAGIFQKPDGHEGVKDTYYENAIHKEHGVQSFVTNVGNINDAYYPNTTQLASHENNTEPNVTSLHSLSEKSFNVSRDSTYLQGQGSHATNTFDLNLQEIQFTQSGHDEDQVSYNLSNQQQSYNLNQGNNTDGYIPHFPTQERFSDVTQQDTTNTYTPHFPERLQERFSDVSQGNVTNSYTSHFQATERLPAVQEKFSSVTQGSNSSGERLERFSDVTQENNTNTYASSERLLGVQERFSDVPQAYNTNSLLGVQERFTDVTQGNTHTSSERLFGVQERFSDLNQTYNTDTYTSQISGSNTLLGVQERFSDVPQGSNTSTHTSGERLLGVQERFSDLNQAYNSNSYTSQMPTPDSLLGVQERFPDVAQGNNTNTYTPHFQPAERLLAVQERFSDAVLRQHTPVQENISRGSTGHFASTGKKRSITEALRTQTINFGDPSGSLTTNTSAQSVPNNDDILSSILVGRSSVMQVEPTPATKRRRQTLPKPPKTGVPKRKVPMDESTVLHGDMIRQQLTDTSDIRRPRKKVSCTWVELSLIHKQLWEDGIFRESLLTGVSVKLASLHSRSYDLRKIRVSRIESSSDAPALKSISQNDENAPEENLHDEANKDVWVENNTTETDPNYNGSEEQTSEANEVREPIVDSETATIEKDGIQSDEKTDVPSVGMDSSIDINSQYIDNKNDEVKMDNEAKDEVVVVGPEVVTIDQEVEEIGKNKEETETLKPEEECNEKELVTNPEGSLGKEVEVDNTENVTPCSKDVISNDKEKSGHQDATNIEDDSDNDNDNDNNTFDDENLEYSPVQNNTDFLNFDDDDVDNDAEEADEDLSDTEAKRIDNSGWSSRTKAVGKYLQVMFDKEGEHGRTGLRMNSLLTGKTRKEASRMFFETLVLKTKDYIHVEQNEPFENIDILPRSKLLKSDF